MSKAIRTKTVINPFANPLAKTNSSYSASRGDVFYYPLEPERSITADLRLAHNRFRAHVTDQDFPCVGAKSAVNNDTYRFGFYDKIDTETATAGLAYDLWEYAKERPGFETMYSTFVATFAAPTVISESEWEKTLWAQLRKLHEVDRQFHQWDPSVSDDPHNSDFSFSFAGNAFFIIGLHPSSSRFARRFAYPAIVFNPHVQFEQLREQNRFDKLRAAIRTRDYNLQGSLNPNLSDFGETSEARQYSGREVEAEWRCPFRPDTNKASQVGT